MENCAKLPYELKRLIYDIYLTMWTDEEVRCNRHPLRNILWDIEDITWGIRDEFDVYEYKKQMHSNVWFYGAQDFVGKNQSIRAKILLERDAYREPLRRYKEWHIVPHSTGFYPKSTFSKSTKLTFSMPKRQSKIDAPGPSRKTQPRRSKTAPKAQKEEETQSLSLADFPSVHGGVTYKPFFEAPAAPTHTPTRADFLKHFHMTGGDYSSNLFPKAPQHEPKQEVVDPDEQLKKRYLKMSNVQRLRTETELQRDYTKLQKENQYKDQELNKRFKKLGGIGKKNTKAKRQKKEKEPKSEESLHQEYQKVFGKPARNLSYLY